MRKEPRRRWIMLPIIRWNGNKYISEKFLYGGFYEYENSFPAYLPRCRSIGAASFRGRPDAVPWDLQACAQYDIRRRGFVHRRSPCFAWTAVSPFLRRSARRGCRSAAHHPRSLHPDFIRSHRFYHGDVAFPRIRRGLLRPFNDRRPFHGGQFPVSAGGGRAVPRRTRQAVLLPR